MKSVFVFVLGFVFVFGCDFERENMKFLCL